MRISVPEFECFDGSYIKSLKASTCLLDYEVERLSYRYSSNAIDNIKGYIVTFLSRLTKSLHTLIYIIEERKDYVVANSIIRMLADNVATLQLIYGSNDINELFFRHYLYVLDGCKTRFNVLPKSINKNEKITESEYNALKNQIEEARNNCKEAMDTIHNILKEHPYHKIHPEAFSRIEADKNWKYKELSTKEKKKNEYSWKDMYLLLDEKKSMASFFSYLSQYVHGLSISNIIIDNNIESFEPIIGIGIFLTGKIKLLTEQIFFDEKEYMKEGYLQSPQGIEHLSYFKSH